MLVVIHLALNIEESRMVEGNEEKQVAEMPDMLALNLTRNGVRLVYALMRLNSRHNNLQETMTAMAYAELLSSKIMTREELQQLQNTINTAMKLVGCGDAGCRNEHAIQLVEP
jgi:hypothetical protein